jgi:tRNA(His) 5'-end guanylyltransferase
LKGLTVWQRIPRPKGLTQQFQTEGDGNENADEILNAEAGVNIERDMDVVEIWKRRFYQNRGDWNREWKRRRREGLKAVRKREKRTAR